MSKEVLSERTDQELIAASERFATALRTVTVETVMTAPFVSGPPRRAGREQLLWSATSDSDWRRYLGRLYSSTIH